VLSLSKHADDLPGGLFHRAGRHAAKLRREPCVEPVETIVRLPNAGAVASWSPTGKGVATGHEDMWIAFYEAVFLQGITEIGPATNQAKQVLYNSDSLFKDLIDTYILFGDPAMALRLLVPDLC
jgi:hypothetical protein